MIEYTITFEPANPSTERFILLNVDLEGETWRLVSGSCAKALARKAFAAGADSVRHAYDLNLDDCAEHTVTRVKP